MKAFSSPTTIQSCLMLESTDPWSIAKKRTSTVTTKTSFEATLDTEIGDNKQAL